MTTSQLLGSPKSNQFSLSCDPGTYISQFDGTKHGWLFNMGATCSDSKKIGPIGTVAPDPWSVRSDTGFSGWDSARFGDATDAITFVSPDGTVLPTIGGTGGGPAQKWSCPSGSRIIGFGGSHDQYGISTQFMCSEIEKPIESVPVSMPPTSSEYGTVADPSTTKTLADYGITTSGQLPEGVSAEMINAIMTSFMSGFTDDASGTSTTSATAEVKPEPKPEVKPEPKLATTTPPPPEKEKSNTWLYIVLVFILFVVIAVVAATVYSQKNKPKSV